MRSSTAADRRSEGPIEVRALTLGLLLLLPLRGDA